MAGMLPGVEAARRRSFHNTPSLSHTHRNHVSIWQKGGLCDDQSKLIAAANEAKKRLDLRFQRQWRTHTKSKQRSRSCMCKMSRWLKIRWKSGEKDDECAICLEQNGRGKALMKLGCRHRFHTKCLVPWLEVNAHCPCCRMPIPSSISKSLNK